MDNELIEGIIDVRQRADKAKEEAENNTVGIGVLREQVQELYREFDEVLSLLDKANVVSLQSECEHRDMFEEIKGDNGK